MTHEHTLQVFDEPPLVGKAANIEAWSGYASSFPDYVIYPHQISEGRRPGGIHRAHHGSHLGLTDEEQNLTVIWVAHVDHWVTASGTLYRCKL